jgi:hypothetical protein
LSPHLSVSAAAQQDPTTPVQSFERLSRRMQKDGYFGESDTLLATLAPKIGDGVKRCIEFGLPAVFVWAYDEPWRCFQRVAPAISHFLGANYKALPNFWAWHVDPSRGEAGWAPHRDYSRGGLAEDGSPLSLTCWIALSEANPLNSCMYIVPAHLDPSYNKPDYSGPPLGPHIARALPAKPGDYFIWNQAVLHWGGLSSEFAESPRMSMALEFQRGEINPINTPLLDPASSPAFAMRIRLIAKQIMQYKHMYRLPDRLAAVANFLLNAPIQES